MRRMIQLHLQVLKALLKYYLKLFAGLIKDALMFYLSSTTVISLIATVYSASMEVA